MKISALTDSHLELADFSNYTVSNISAAANTVVAIAPKGRGVQNILFSQTGTGGTTTIELGTVDQNGLFTKMWTLYSAYNIPSGITLQMYNLCSDPLFPASPEHQVALRFVSQPVGSSFTIYTTNMLKVDPYLPNAIGSMTTRRRFGSAIDGPFTELYANDTGGPVWVTDHSCLATGGPYILLAVAPTGSAPADSDVVISSASSVGLMAYVNPSGSFYKIQIGKIPANHSLFAKTYVGAATTAIVNYTIKGRSLTPG